MSEIYEIKTYGSWDLKGIGRQCLVKFTDLPDGRKLVMGDIVLHRGCRKKIVGISLLNRDLGHASLTLDDVE